MPFHTIDKRGINHFYISNSVPEDKLSAHITVVEPGKRAHPPHVHGGVEAFCMLEGEGTMETEGEKQVLRANDIIVLDPTKEHGLVNTGSAPMRYMVIIAK